MNAELPERAAKYIFIAQDHIDMWLATAERTQHLISTVCGCRPKFSLIPIKRQSE